MVEGTNVDAIDGSGKMALHLGVEHGEAASIAKLLEYGVHTDVLDADSKILLDYAQSTGCDAIMTMVS